MVLIRKKNKQTSLEDLFVATKKFISLLEKQNETDAAAVLQSALQKLEQSQYGSPTFIAALSMISEAFDGEMELNAYTFKRAGSADRWSDADDLFLASTSVLNLVRRLSK